MCFCNLQMILSQKDENDLRKFHEDLIAEITSRYRQNAKSTFHSKLPKAIKKMNNTLDVMVKHRKDITDITLQQQQLQNALEQEKKESRRAQQRQREESQRKIDNFTKQLNDQKEQFKKETNDYKNKITALEGNLRNKDYTEEMVSQLQRKCKKLEKDVEYLNKTKSDGFCIIS